MSMSKRYVSVTAEHYERIQKAAKRAGVSPAKLIERALEKAESERERAAVIAGLS